MTLANNPHDSFFRNAFARLETAQGFFERYLAQVSGQLDEVNLRQALLQALPPDMGDHVMPTLAETWVEQGKKQGIEEGLEKGSLTSLRATLRRQLIKRFGSLPQAIDSCIEQADAQDLEVWLDQVIDAASLESVFANTH